MEVIIHNPLNKPFIPYTKPISGTVNTVSPPIAPKPPFYNTNRSLPRLLPTSKFAPNTNTNYQKPFYPPIPKPPNIKPEPNATKTSKPPTREERDERRRKGLCMWCGLKFGPGHTCFRSQLYQLLVEEPGGKTEKNIE